MERHTISDKVKPSPKDPAKFQCCHQCRYLTITQQGFGRLWPHELTENCGWLGVDFAELKDGAAALFADRDVPKL